MKKHLYAFALLLGTSSFGAAAAEQYPVDKATGLIMAPGWEIVKNQCNACHTSLIIPQNVGSREVWRDTIQWMIDTQGLWDLNETWDPVLDYLETYYNESGINMKIFRRKPLEAAQMPPLPQQGEQE
ncbi:cytochrome c [Shewanella hanedai]|uniref:Cytochrome C n=1 Tax=Shewanella hanedai TaxID=25 RepID=A0A553JJ68_SHEHA|nr:cytochrome C [Shewanella hanedai]TRY12502.1 cytochrome C [Shewanella hanedai]GGI95639.1 cytochrome c [Shewanella hanedai]